MKTNLLPHLFCAVFLAIAAAACGGGSSGSDFVVTGETQRVETQKIDEHNEDGATDGEEPSDGECKTDDDCGPDAICVQTAKTCYFKDGG